MKRTQHALFTAAVLSAIVLVYATLGCQGPGAAGAKLQPEQSFWSRLFGTSAPDVKLASAAPIVLGDAGPQVEKPGRIETPKTFRGVYLNNHHGRDPKLLPQHMANMKKYGLNAVVIDVQPRMPAANIVAALKAQGVYTVARLVCWEGGLKVVRPSEKDMQDRIAKLNRAADAGFDEVQLDYIRYADKWGYKTVKPAQRYEILSQVLDRFKKAANAKGVAISADVFGRVPFNTGDIIGQRLEEFGAKMDVIYPMLYPSHFDGDEYRQAKPYETIYEGVARSVQRMNAKPELAKTKIVAYIQAFQMRNKISGLTFDRYIYDQIVAGERAGAGWIAWNARNDYSWTWKALDLVEKHKHDLVPDKQVVFKSYQPKRKLGKAT